MLFEYTRIAADMHFKDMIVSRQYCVNRRGETLYQGDEATALRWGDARAEALQPKRADASKTRLRTVSNYFPETNAGPMSWKGPSGLVATSSSSTFG